MTLTYDRAFLLTKIVTADKELGKMLLNFEAEEATAQINALGYNFKVEEIREYSTIIMGYMGDI